MADHKLATEFELLDYMAGQGVVSIVMRYVNEQPFRLNTVVKQQLLFPQ